MIRVPVRQEDRIQIGNRKSLIFQTLRAGFAGIQQEIALGSLHENAGIEPIGGDIAGGGAEKSYCDLWGESRIRCRKGCVERS